MKGRGGANVSRIEGPGIFAVPPKQKEKKKMREAPDCNKRNLSARVRPGKKNGLREKRGKF